MFNCCKTTRHFPTPGCSRYIQSRKVCERDIACVAWRKPKNNTRAKYAASFMFKSVVGCVVYGVSTQYGDHIYTSVAAFKKLNTLDPKRVPAAETQKENKLWNISHFTKRHSEEMK